MAAPTSPRPAATLALLRDSPRGPEVLLTVRPRRLRFMGGAVVFPGGALAPEDRDPRWERACNLDRDTAAARFCDDPGAALGWAVCALREAFEEVGLLLAVGGGGLPRAAGRDPGVFLQECLKAGVVLDVAGLTPLGRWITPAGSPVRFDTRFFAARAPAGFEPDPDPAEVEGCRWATPSEALAALGRGEAVMAPPTIATLQSLAGAGSVGEALSGAARPVGSPSAGGPPLVTPVADGVVLVLAPNPGPMTGPGTNSYALPGPRPAVVDPAVDDPDYLAALRGAAGGRVELVLVTHRHPDHIGGVRALAGQGATVRAVGGDPVEGVTPDPLRPGERVAAGALELEVVHAPGHAPDHVALFEPRRGLLFAGDNVLGEGTTVIAPPGGDMAAYMQTLERLQALGARLLLPGHFRPRDDPDELIAHYIAHRAERRAAVLAALARPRRVEEIVEEVYVDTPAELKDAAALQVRALLRMLSAEGLVSRVNDRWRRSDVE